jgi:glycine cleavage system H lipoate-binding protein/ABC-type phosphate transport system substrate-binding protein
MSIKLADEYNKLYPQAGIKVISMSEDQITDNLLNDNAISIVSDEKNSGFSKGSFTKTVLGRDVIVPVINSRNPYAEGIALHGISPESLANFLANNGLKNWGTLLNTNVTAQLHYYQIDDESISRSLTEFLKTNITVINGIKVKSSEEMILAIQSDPYAIGFCRMASILDFKTEGMAENIMLLPIDRNNNGLIDYNEKIYDDLTSFSRGIWIGKYPKALYSSVFAITSDKSENEEEVAFLKWVLTGGQKVLFSNGYTDLLATERQTGMDNLNNARIISGAAIDNKSLSRSVIYIILIIALVAITTNLIARYMIRKERMPLLTIPAAQKILDENAIIVPGGIYFDKTHTWVFMEQDGVAKVGIDDFLQHITGTITRVKLKNPGEKVKKGEQIVSLIQNGKQLNLYSPVSGIIKERNNILDTSSSIINSSPYNEGWIYKIEPTNWLRENQLLFMAEKQKRFIKNEISRLKEFLSLTLNTGNENYARIILQDGGELHDGTLSNLGPEVWEDFQTKFIDPSRQIWFYEMF